MAESKTKYITFTGKGYWIKPFTPDEFRGAKRWTVDLVMDSPDEWAKFKEAGIQKKVKENENGKFWSAYRPTTKLMKGQLVNFVPPYIYDKDGNVLVKYTDEFGKDIRSFEGDKIIKRVGEPFLIGNGSTISVTVSVYPTSMGNGNRLESIRVIDLIEYTKPETPSEVAQKIEEQIDAGEEVSDAPW